MFYHTAEFYVYGNMVHGNNQGNYDDDNDDDDEDDADDDVDDDNEHDNNADDADDDDNDDDDDVPAGGLGSVRGKPGPRAGGARASRPQDACGH